MTNESTEFDCGDIAMIRGGYIFYGSGEPLYEGAPLAPLVPITARFDINIPEICSHRECPRAGCRADDAWREGGKELLFDIEYLMHKFNSAMVELERQRYHLLIALFAANEDDTNKFGDFCHACNEPDGVPCPFATSFCEDDGEPRDKFCDPGSPLFGCYGLPRGWRNPGAKHYEGSIRSGAASSVGAPSSPNPKPPVPVPMSWSTWGANADGRPPANPDSGEECGQEREGQ